MTEHHDSVCVPHVPGKFQPSLGKSYNLPVAINMCVCTCVRYVPDTLYGTG